MPTPLVAHHGLEAVKCALQGHLPCSKGQKCQPLLAQGEYRATPRREILHRRYPRHSVNFNFRYSSFYGSNQVRKRRVQVRVSDGGEGAGTALFKRFSDHAGGVCPVLGARRGVVGEGEEEACDPPGLQVRPHDRLCPPDLARIPHRHEDLVGIREDAQTLERQKFRVSRPDAYPDQPTAHARTPTARALARALLSAALLTRRRGTSGVAAQWACR